MKWKLSRLDLFYLAILIADIIAYFWETKITFFRFLCVIVTFFVASAFTGLLHELGHFIGGKIDGYHLLYLDFAIFRITNKDGKIRMCFHFPFSLQTAMYPNKQNDKWFLYNAGGIIMNILTGMVLLFLSFKTSGIFLLFLLQMSITNNCCAAINAIPCKSNDKPNDGWIIRLLFSSLPARKDFLYYLQLYRDIFFHLTVEKKLYEYQRDETSNDDELIFYNEIQSMLDNYNKQH